MGFARYHTEDNTSVFGGRAPIRQLGDLATFCVATYCANQGGCSQKHQATSNVPCHMPSPGDTPTGRSPRVLCHRSSPRCLCSLPFLEVLKHTRALRSVTLTRPAELCLTFEKHN